MKLRNDASMMDGKSEPSLAGVGNLYRKCQVFPADYTCFIAKYGGVNTSFSRANVPEVKVYEV